MKQSVQPVTMARKAAPWAANTVVSALLFWEGWRMAASARPTAPCLSNDNGALTCVFIGRASPQAEHGILLLILAFGLWCAIGAAIALVGEWGGPRAQPAMRAASLLMLGFSCDLLLCALASFVTPITWDNDAAPGLFGPLESPGLLLEISVLGGLVAAVIFLAGSSAIRGAH